MSSPEVHEDIPSSTMHEDIPYMTICKVVNCICCIPFVIVLIFYLTRIKE